ncbi:MAG: phosphoenolpyruvate--protein phosphotransferase [Planctomycetes bacterium]|nr:phosphoenolpyruvate--protein phosphotransferase [Planctomycetota bacterium]
METRKGIPVSPGIAIREAMILDTEEIHIPQRFIESERVEAEAARYEEGVRAAEQSLQREIERMGGDRGINAQILEIHKTLLGDPVLKNEILSLIRQKQYTAEHAVARTMSRYIKKFEVMDSPIIAERVHDLYDIEKLLLSTLLGSRLDTMQELDREVVVIAHNLTPAQAAKLDSKWVRGFAMDVGGKTSHTAIMARALGIPAVVALEEISTAVIAGDTVIIDGFRGLVIVDPDDATLRDYRAREANVHKVARRLRKETTLPSETIDGHRVELQANVELPQEVHAAMALGAAGIGLLRTEFIHFQKPRGGEAWHLQHYQRVLKEVGDRPVTIRTLDLGGDKGLERAEDQREENPFLGCRSIRYCFANPELFREQLRAILRASMFGRVKIMFPMVGSVGDVERAVGFFEQVKEELRQNGEQFDTEIPVGVMVEVPSLAITADQVARHVQFFSIGTNDLVQYTLAVDRGNEHVAALYDPVHPAVLRLLAASLAAGDRAGIEVSICGEMASERLYIPLLIGLGYRRLSVSPPMIPEVRRIVRSIQVYDAVRLAAQCSGLADGMEIAALLRSWARDYLPDTGW